MAFIGNKTRKNIDVNILADIDVISIPPENMILRDSSHTAYFKRLGYKNCPTVKVKAQSAIFNLKSNESLVDMNRWDQIRDIYSVLIKIDRSPRTKINMFNAVVTLIQNCDKKNIEIIFTFESIKLFVNELKNRYLGGIKGKTLMQIQSSIKTILFRLLVWAYEIPLINSKVGFGVPQ